ncbi:SigB/SigF/SigG family RNA polymerase sigma factor [Streptacidiphilus monticola]|uniref:SigB/SigF/SigG family RNA polymerase sigma factor n=1 Tax=Streptacidiphilus monticola TaxID=2161674 RepID=A0ABW1FXY4_9ACTN
MPPESAGTRGRKDSSEYGEERNVMAAALQQTQATTLPDPAPEAPRQVAPADAKQLSVSLFARLREVEEGSAEYSYVRSTLIELNMSLVSFVAGRFRGSSEPMEDIVQVGTVGLIKAIDRFEPERGVEFTTFAVPTIVGEIRRFFRDTTWAVHVPRRLQELRLLLARSREELEQTLGREPTVAELSEALRIPEEEVIEGLTASNGYTAGSLDLGDSDEGGENPLADRIGAPDPEFDKVENLHALKPLIAALPDRDRLILSLRFCSDLTQSEIGERLGLSQMHVSRLLARSLAKLRAGLDAE